jgi:hypothetical protein
MSKFKVGDRVMHDFSKVIGEVKSVIDMPGNKYKYFVYWHSEQDGDWYEEKVLVKAKPTGEGENNATI